MALFFMHVSDLMACSRRGLGGVGQGIKHFNGFCGLDHDFVYTRGSQYKNDIKSFFIPRLAALDLSIWFVFVFFFFVVCAAF